MAREKKEKELTDFSSEAVVSEKSTIVVEQIKEKFMIWFGDALDRFDGLKPHHLQSVQVYFKTIGIEDPNTVEAFDLGLTQFGFRRK